MPERMPKTDARQAGLVARELVVWLVVMALGFLVPFAGRVHVATCDGHAPVVDQTTHANQVDHAHKVHHAHPGHHGCEAHGHHSAEPCSDGSDAGKQAHDQAPPSEHQPDREPDECTTCALLAVALKQVDSPPVSIEVPPTRLIGVQSVQTRRAPAHCWLADARVRGPPQMS